MLVLEDPATGEVRGTCQLMSQVGQRLPFYSYRLNTLTQHSEKLQRTVRAEMLSLVTDLEGSSEVGGLFLHPNQRAGGLGMLLARSRYLFIAMHRARFADRVLAELRGVQDERGGSPFWDGVAGPVLRHELPGGRLLQRHQRQPVHRRPDAQAPGLRRHAQRQRAQRDRHCRTPRAARRCGCSRRKASSTKATSTSSTAARP